jgi:hypothetical protein
LHTQDILDFVGSADKGSVDLSAPKLVQLHCTDAPNAFLRADLDGAHAHGESVIARVVVIPHDARYTTQ